MAGAFKHAFPSPVPDEGIATEVGSDEWNAPLVMSEGADGQAAVRRTSAPNGWELINLGALLAFINATQAANSGSGETDLHSFSLAAAHFNANKRKIRVTAEGSFDATGAVNKTLKLKFGAAGTVTLNPTTTQPANVRFKVTATIIRTASNAQRILVEVKIGATNELISLTNTTETDSGALIVKLTGQGTASNQILLDESMVEFLN
jgi:hypothetical protein